VRSKAGQKGQLNLVNGTKNEKIRKTKNKHQIDQKKRPRWQTMKAVRGWGEKWNYGIGKRGRFKLRVKEGVLGEQSGETTVEEVIHRPKGTGELETEEL